MTEITIRGIENKDIGEKRKKELLEKLKNNDTYIIIGAMKESSDENGIKADDFLMVGGKHTELIAMFKGVLKNVVRLMKEFSQKNDIDDCENCDDKHTCDTYYRKDEND